MLYPTPYLAHLTLHPTLPIPHFISPYPTHYPILPQIQDNTLNEILLFMIWDLCQKIRGSQLMIKSSTMFSIGAFFYIYRM